MGLTWSKAEDAYLRYLLGCYSYTPPSNPDAPFQHPRYQSWHTISRAMQVRFGPPSSTQKVFTSATVRQRFERRLRPLLLEEPPKPGPSGVRDGNTHGEVHQGEDATQVATQSEQQAVREKANQQVAREKAREERNWTWDRMAERVETEDFTTVYEALQQRKVSKGRETMRNLSRNRES